MQDIYKPLRSKSYSVPCELCSIGSSLCIPILLNTPFPTILERRQSFSKNDILATKDSPFQKFFIIHSGALKTYTMLNGDEQINGFYFPGDIVGLECISTKRYSNSIKALTHTLVCELKFEELMEIITNNTEVRDMVFTLMSEDIDHYQKLILCYSQKNAEEKVATFIHSLYLRYAQRGHKSLNIKLAMGRNDIANYLGLTIETISRILTRMQELNILIARGKYIFIKNLSALAELAIKNNK